MEDIESLPTSTNHHEKEDKSLLTTTSTTSPPMTKNKTCQRVCLIITALILGLVILFLILGLTVLKPKRPITNVNSISLSGLDFSLQGFRVTLNVTLNVTLSVRNPNRVGFKYTDNTAILRYRGIDVGEVPVPAGRIGSRETNVMNLTLTLMADRIISDPNLFHDVASGTLPLQIYVRLAGKVRIVVSFHVVAYATCDLEIGLISRDIQQQTCHYKTKL